MFKRRSNAPKSQVRLLKQSNSVPLRLAVPEADPISLEQRLNEVRDSIYAYCFHKLGTVEDAEDATQRVLFRAAQRFDSFVDRGDGSFKAWVTKIAENEVIDEIRRRKRDRQVPMPDGVEWVDPDPNPEERAVRSTEREYFHTLIQHLPPDQRAVLEYRTAELNTAEIAELMSTSQDNVRQLQGRALEAVRTRLREQEERDAR